MKKLVLDFFNNIKRFKKISIIYNNGNLILKMAKISYTSIHDIYYIRKNIKNLTLLIRKINNKNIYGNDYYEEIIKIIYIVKLLAHRRPVIFRPIDIDYIESLEITFKDMINDNNFNELFIKNTSKNFLELLMEKEKKYRILYGI